MFDLTELIKAIGYIGLTGIVFAESGLLIGFFLPGDSLLFTAGFLASQGFLDIKILIPLLFAAAVIGDNVGYAFGKRVGPRLFTKEESLLFHRDHLRRSQEFFNRHGGKTLILARFLPAIRTFAPILAGVGKMDYRKFLVYNMVGGFLWAVGMTLAGYYLGRIIPGIDHYIVPIVLGIVIISALPTILHLLRDQKLRSQIISFIKERIFRSK